MVPKLVVLMRIDCCIKGLVLGGQEGGYREGIQSG